MPSLSDIPTWVFLAATVLNYGVVGVLIAYLVVKRRDTRATLAWIFFLLLVPFLAVPAFWVLGFNRLRAGRWRRRKASSTIGERLQPLACTVSGCEEPNEFPADPGLLQLARKLDGVSALGGNAVELYRDGKNAFAAIEAAIDGAAHHVHLLYYIWKDDTTGARMRDALVRAARRGVEVRLLLDEIGSLGTSDAFFRELLGARGKLARFFPLGLFGRRLAINNRNHRKIVVVDGALGFTGGMNSGDEYAGLGVPWQDAHVRLQGPAVLRLQDIFGQAWLQATEEDLALSPSFPRIARRGAAGAQVGDQPQIGIARRARYRDHDGVRGKPVGNQAVHVGGTQTMQRLGKMRLQPGPPQGPGGPLAFAGQLAGGRLPPCPLDGCPTCALLDEPGACVGVIEPPISPDAEQWLAGRLPAAIDSLPGELLRQNLQESSITGAGAASRGSIA